MAAKYNQGDVVVLNFPVPLPDNTAKNHPVIIISSNRSNSYESSYTGIMMTHHIDTSSYSFELLDCMFESPLKRSLEQPRCFARIYITVFFTDLQVRPLVTKMLPSFFKMIMKRVHECVFNID